MKMFSSIATLSLLLVLIAGTAFAHKVRVFAYVEGNDIVGETAFSGGKSAKNVAVEVYNDADNALISSTTTDEKGEFSLPIPDLAREQRLNLKIVVNGGDGHRNSWLLNADEYLPAPETNDTNQVAPPAAQTPAEVSPAATGVPGLPGAEIRQAIDEETLRRIVDESVEKQLRPVKHMLAQTKEKQISLQDIIGGLGYIFGLAGVAAYFSSRKKSEKGEH